MPENQDVEVASDDAEEEYTGPTHTCIDCESDARLVDITERGLRFKCPACGTAFTVC